MVVHLHLIHLPLKTCQALVKQTEWSCKTAVVFKQGIRFRDFSWVGSICRIIIGYIHKLVGESGNFYKWKFLESCDKYWLMMSLFILSLDKNNLLVQMKPWPEFSFCQRLIWLKHVIHLPISCQESCRIFSLISIAWAKCHTSYIWKKEKLILEPNMSSITNGYLGDRSQNSPLFVSFTRNHMHSYIRFRGHYRQWL